MQTRELQLEGPGHEDRAAVDLERRRRCLDAVLEYSGAAPLVRGNAVIEPDALEAERWALVLYGGLQRRSTAMREVTIHETQREALQRAADAAGGWEPELLVNLGTGRGWSLVVTVRPGELSERRFGA